MPLIGKLILMIGLNKPELPHDKISGAIVQVTLGKP